MATEYEIKIRQGDAFDFSVTYKSGGSPVDLSGYTSEMVITWPNYRDGFRAPIEAGEINLTMDATTSGGVVGAHLTAEQTATLPVSGYGLGGPPVRYQLRITSGGDPMTLLAGNAVVEPDYFDLVT